MAFVPDSQVNDSDFSLPPVGWNRVEIAEADRKATKQDGHPYFNVKLVDPNTKDVLGWDTFMLAGRGNGIGIGKMVAIGAAARVDGGYELPDRAGDLVGIRAWAYFNHEEYEKDGQTKTRAKVDIKFGDKGYLHEDDTPPAAEMPTGSTSSDPDDPFSEYAGSDAASTDDEIDTPFAVLLPLIGTISLWLLSQGVVIG